jgi:hypothetical protein
MITLLAFGVHHMLARPCTPPQSVVDATTLFTAPTTIAIAEVGAPASP